MTKTAKIFFVIAVIAMLAAIGVGVGWAVTARQAAAQAEVTEARLDNAYRAAYYDLTYHVGNLSDTFNKLTVAGSKPYQMQLLGKANVYATGASQALSTLTDSSPQWGKLNRMINQAGDYALALQTKLQRGQDLTSGEKDNLSTLYAALLRLERALTDAQDDLNAEGYSFAKALGGAGDLLGAALDGLGADINYPALIYDGPFSDALTDRQVKGVQGQTLSAQEAAARLSAYLPGIGTPTLLGELGGDIPAYRYTVDRNGMTYYADITKQGGYLMSLSSTAEPQDTVCTEEQALSLARDYLTGLGLTEMQAVWVSNYNSVYYLNYAYVQDGVVVYSDLVVVKINAETGALLGVEALNYLYNHTARAMPNPQVSESQARAIVHGELSVQAVRLALIPTQGGGEKLTWEVYGTKGSEKYFVYVDAMEGYEYKILRVIDSEQGQLLQ